MDARTERNVGLWLYFTGTTAFSAFVAVFDWTMGLYLAGALIGVPLLQAWLYKKFF